MRAGLRNQWNLGDVWAKRLNPKQVSVAADEPGLVMVQIDGFSRSELESAIDRGEMPFLKELLFQEHYRLHSFYPGLPSTTPAVQGELFYGVKQAVPFFFFFDRQKQKVFRMFDGDAVREMESRLSKKGNGLLNGGSSYSNIYSGGAQETHFCAGSLGWGYVWKDVNVINFILLLLTHFFAVVRMVLLCVWESILAIVDCIRGVLDREDLMVELKFVYLRVILGLLLRELVTVGALMDIARGLPIIHLNYIGYDEQSHRRRPGSINAHWVLKGIDQSIKKIYAAATHSHKRHYDVWIYSDHGQEVTIPYVTFHKQTVEDAVAKVYGRMFEGHGELRTEELRDSLTRNRGIQGYRARYISQWPKRFFPSYYFENNEKNKDLVVTAMGPLGGIYVQKYLSKSDAKRFAQELIREAKIPLILMAEGRDKVVAFTERGEFMLPDEANQIISISHPFFNEVIQDLVSLVHHPNAGTLTISGWRKDATAFSFPFENGAHAGPGEHETGAFALIPSHIPVAHFYRGFLRPLDLRHMALDFLNKNTLKKVSSKSNQKYVRLMTYNVHSCIGMDGRLSVERIARVIGRYQPDIVALQELEMGRQRTNLLDQTHMIARELQMHYQFYPSLQVQDERYGNAILSRFPLELVRAGKLPALNRIRLEPRGALWVSVRVAGVQLQIINTHLSFYIPESKVQAKHLAGSEWILDPRCANPAIICGDFNSLPYSQAWKSINTHFKDAQLLLNGHRPLPTWSVHWPMSRIDHVFVSSGIKILKVDVPRTQLNQVASDHLPLIVDLAFEGLEEE